MMPAALGPPCAELVRLHPRAVLWLWRFVGMDQSLLVISPGRGLVELLARNAVDGTVWLYRRSGTHVGAVPGREVRHHFAGGRLYG